MFGVIWRGQVGGVGLSLAFGGAHLGRNALYSHNRRGNGVSRLFKDNRKWNTVRDQWSKAAGGGQRALQKNGQSLHHWLIPQRFAEVNAGFNYLPLTAGFNSWMNGSTRTRVLVENALKLQIFGIYSAPIVVTSSPTPAGCECS